MASIPGIPDPQSVGQAVHRRQYLDFKVVVYRLAVPIDVAKVQLISGDEIDINEVLSTDFNDIAYQGIVSKLNKIVGDQSVFQDFLDKMATILQTEMTKNGIPKSTRALTGDGIFRELDITPIVRSVTTQMALEGCNTCTLTAIDPYLSSFDGDNKARYLRESPMPSPAYLNVIRSEDLDTFTFREFDLIRVFAFSAIDETAKDHLSSMQVRADNLVLPEETARRFAMRPIFTGFISSITSANSVDQVSSLQVTAVGVQRMFMQSVTVFSDALANVIANASPEMTILKDGFSAFSNNFTGMSVDEIVKKIFTDYLHPYFLASSNSAIALSKKAPDISAPAEDPDVSVGMPSLTNLLNSLYVRDRAKVIPSVIPMLPAVLLLHILKTKYREPILTFDDRLTGPLEYVPDVESSPSFETVVSRDAGSLPNIMQPYLAMARDTYSTFNASYASAAEIFDTIRQTTYMEIFEDKTGQFHFRFPRYNHATIMHDIPVSENLSVTTQRDDSSVYSVNVSQAAVQFSDAGSLIDGKVFIDKASVLRYGFRRPQTLENPNSVSPDFSAVLAKFVRDYKAGREARDAHLEIVGRPDIEVGSMVIFRIGRLQRQGGQINTNKTDLPDGAVKTMVGYVMNVSDRFSVSERYTQVLDLAFVREASSWSLGDAGSFMNGTLWDLFDRRATRILGTPISLEGDVGSGTVKKPEPKSDAEANGTIVVSANKTKPEDFHFLPLIYVPGRSMRTARFRSVASAIELAEKCNTPQIQNDLAAYGAVSVRKNGDDGKMPAADILMNMKSTAARINDRLVNLAIWQRTAGILKQFSGQTKIFSERLTPGGLDIRLSRADVTGLASQMDAALDSINKESLRSGGETLKIRVKGATHQYVVTLSASQRQAATVSFDSVLQMIASFNRAGHESFVSAWNTVFRSPNSTNSPLTKEQYARATAVAKDLNSGVDSISKLLQTQVNEDIVVSDRYVSWDSWNGLLEEAKSQGIVPNAVAPSPLRGLGIVDMTTTETKLLE